MRRIIEQLRRINSKMIFIGAVAIMLLLISGISYWVFILRTEDATKTITIAVMHNDYVKNYNTNYYTEWLEEKSGYNIQFEYVMNGYEEEYLNTMLISENSGIDAVFINNKDKILTEDKIKSLGRQGLIVDISDYITEDSNYYRISKQYKMNGIAKQIASDEAVYFFPNMDTARKSQNFQIMWMNEGWLKNLGLQIPRTTDELVRVLEAFKQNDPNRNGKQDELPMISCEENYYLQSYNFLLNAFIYNDPLNGRVFLDENGKLVYAFQENNFREGLSYCNALYKNNLLSNSCFYYSEKQLRELANDPKDLVGCFTSKSISDVIYSNCPDILANYIQVPPLVGPDGQQYAVKVDSEPKIGGYIPGNSKHKKEAFEIMDLMLSSEASLVAEFGEKGIDWTYSESGDLSTYGTQATITTIQYLSDKMQNKNFAGSGPLVLDKNIANGVTWNGNYSLVEYIDARAVRTYESFYRKEEGAQNTISLANDNRNKYIDNMILNFIKGDIRISDNRQWENYLDEVRNYYE